jgi:N-acetylglucosaminyl-diphospho-decaprenol L-rhamnosyltransferase
MPPRLSVVIPTCQTRELTLRCVDSLQACPLGSSEVIVVDDGSTDGTAEALRRRHPTVKLVTLAPGRGFTIAANRGMGEARGELLFLLNSDTEVEPATVPRLVAAFDDNRRLGVAGVELRFADGRPQWSAGHVPTLPWLFGVASGMVRTLELLPGYRWLRPEGGARDRVDWVCGAAMAVRREVWLAVGGFDERFHFYCQDLDLCLRVQVAGWTVEVVSGARVTHVGGATIGQRPGAAGDRSHPALLWTDLVRWATKHGGPRSGRNTARSLRLGGAIRVGARTLISPFLPPARRETWTKETRAFQQALTALAEGRPER